jgi:hypothetical protein
MPGEFAAVLRSLFLEVYNRSIRRAQDFGRNGRGGRAGLMALKAVLQLYGAEFEERPGGYAIFSRGEELGVWRRENAMKKIL